MDDFTQALAELSYQTVKARQRKRVPVTVNDVSRQIDRHWVNYRDGIIATWADRIFAKGRPSFAKARRCRLAALTERVFDLLAEHGEHWEYPHDGDQAEWTAWGVAVLQWIHLELAGKAAIPCFTQEELKVWLNERQPGQLSMF